MTSDLSSRQQLMWSGCVVLDFSKYEFGTSDEVDLDFGENARSLGGTKMSKIHITSRDRVKAYCVRAVCAKM